MFTQVIKNTHPPTCTRTRMRTRTHTLKQRNNQEALERDWLLKIGKVSYRCRLSKMLRIQFSTWTFLTAWNKWLPLFSTCQVCSLHYEHIVSAFVYQWYNCKDYDLYRLSLLQHCHHDASVGAKISWCCSFNQQENTHEPVTRYAMYECMLELDLA